jgi:hypothetical protein
VWSGTWFWAACKLRVLLTFFKWVKKSRGEDYFMIHENYVKFQCRVYKQNFSGTSLAIHLQVVYNDFCTIIAEVRLFKRYYVTHKVRNI